MAKILNFQTKQQPEQQQNIIVLPHIFSKLLKQYQKYQSDIKNKKIEFLKQQAFQYFYERQPVKNIVPQGLDLPAFVLRQQEEEKRCSIAEFYASQVMITVIAEDRVDECYTRRVKELKNLGIKAHF